MNRRSLERLVTKVRDGRPAAAHLMKQGISDVKQKLLSVQKELDEFFKISDVKEAQFFVTDAERKFLEARRSAGQSKRELAAAQLSLKEARKKLDRCPRDSEYYLAYVSEEHAILMNEQKLKRAYEDQEQDERELFTEYSNAVRISHEKERERAQKTKYWSIIGSISGTVVGFLGSSLITYYRLKQVRQMASPEHIINEVCNEIKDGNLKQAMLQQTFEANTLSMIQDLEQKIQSPSNKNSSMLPVAQNHDILDETRKVIKHSEMEIKDCLKDYSEKQAHITENLTVDLKNNIEAVSEKLSTDAESLLMKSIEEENRHLEQAFSKSLGEISHEMLGEISRNLKLELKQISDDQKFLTEQIVLVKRALLNTKTTSDVQESIQVVSDEEPWQSNANIAISLLNFCLLFYVILAKN